MSNRFGKQRVPGCQCDARYTCRQCLNAGRATPQTAAECLPGHNDWKRYPSNPLDATNTITIPANPAVRAVDPTKWPAVAVDLPTATVRDRLPGFLKAAQAIIDKAWAVKGYTHSPAPQLRYAGAGRNGRKYLRIILDDVTHSGSVSSTSVYCFVDLSNGNVLKAAGWKAPAKHARSNVFDADYGAAGLTEHGAKYL